MSDFFPEGEPRQWNEQMLYRRLVLANTNPDKAISEGELPIALSLPSFRHAAEDDFRLDRFWGHNDYYHQIFVREDISGFQLIFGAAGEESLERAIQIYKDRHTKTQGVFEVSKDGISAHIAMQKLAATWLARDCLFVGNYHFPFRSREPECHLLLKTRETQLDDASSEMEIGNFLLEVMTIAERQYGYLPRDRSPENLLRIQQASAQVFKKWLERKRIAHYTSQNSDTLIRITDKNIES